jgi:hypothetical protein
MKGGYRGKSNKLPDDKTHNKKSFKKKGQGSSEIQLFTRLRILENAI